MSEKEQQNTNNAHVGESYTMSRADDEISLKELILKIREWMAYLWTKKWTIIIAGIIGGALGLAYALVKKPIYTATTTFVLEEGESGGGLGQYAALASMVGVDLGGGGGGIFKGDNILELYKSRKMITEALLTKDTFNGKQQLLIDRYIEFNHLRDKWKDDKELVNIQFKDALNRFTIKQDSVLGLIVKDINDNHLDVTKPDKNLSVISVKMKNKDELFAKAFAENIVANVNEFYIKTKTKKSAENLAILQHQADSVKAVLNKSITGVALAVDANPNSNPAFQTLRVPSQKKQVDVQASGAVYEEIVKNLELAKISYRKEKPLIQVIDEPVFPLENNGIEIPIGIILGGIVVGFLTVLYLLMKRIYVTIMS